MAFLLYDVRSDAEGKTRFEFRSELKGETSLWRTGGPVARSARYNGASDDGPWVITEADLLNALLPSGSSPTAILDDLVPRGPEIRVGRILEIRGFLDSPYTDKPTERYNPILITMEEILHLRPNAAPQDPLEREKCKHSILMPSPPVRRIRTINYLWHSWRPPRSFSGAILTDDQWNYLTG